MMARSGLRMALTPLATILSASMSRPESVSSRIANFGSSTAICRISLRFFSPPEKPSFTERFGPMFSCTSPGFISRSIPLRISWLSTFTFRFLISSKLIPIPLDLLSDTAFQADAQQLLCLNGKLHRQFAEHALAETVDDHGNRIFRLKAPLAQVKELVLADLGRRSLMFHPGGRVPHFDVGKGMRTALVADQQRVALRVIPRAGGALHNFHQPSIRVLSVAGGDTLRDRRAAGVLANVDHLRARIGLLIIVGQRDRVELSYRVVALQNAAWILPGDCGAGFDLCPGDF